MQAQLGRSVRRARVLWRGRAALSTERPPRKPIDSTPTGAPNDGFRRASVKAERRLRKRKEEILAIRRGAVAAEEEGGDFAEMARVEADARLKPLPALMSAGSDFLPSLLRLAASPRTRVRYTASKMLGALPLAQHRATLEAAVDAVAGEDRAALERAVAAVEDVHARKGFDPGNSALLRELAVGGDSTQPAA